MHHDIHQYRPASRPATFRPHLFVIAVIVVVTGLVSLAVPVTPVPEGPMIGADQTEDWHGNVRRSHWPLGDTSGL